MTAFWYFADILVQISPNNKNLDIVELYMERAVEKCPRWIFLTPRKRLNLMSNIRAFSMKHPVSRQVFLSTTYIRQIISIIEILCLSQLILFGGFDKKYPQYD